MQALKTKGLMVLILAFASAPVTAQRSALDTQLPVTAVEERACRHMLTKAPANQQTDIWFDPYTLKGIAREPGIKIKGFLYPKTPFFDFYFAWERYLTVLAPIRFPREIDCVVGAGLEQDGKLRWSHVPDGDYYVAVMTQKVATMSGSDEHHDTLVNGVGVPVGEINSSSTPYAFHYTAFYMVHIAIKTQGGNLVMGPEWKVAP